MISRHESRIAVLLVVAFLVAEIGGHGQRSEPRNEPSGVPGAFEPVAESRDLGFLAFGDVRRQKIVRGGSHRYQLRIPRGKLIRIDVEELNGDVELLLEGPDGAGLPPIDTAKDDSLVEPLHWISRVGGPHRLVVLASKPSAYELRFGHPKNPTAEDRLRMEAYLSFYRARAISKEDRKAAAHQFRMAIGRWEELGESRRRARALFELAEVLPAGPEKLAALHEALDLFADLGDRRHVARCWRNLGGLGGRSRPREASEHYRRASELWLSLGDRLQASYAAFDRAIVLRRSDRSPEEVRASLQLALDLLDPGADPVHEARIHTALADFYHSMGEVPRSLRESRHALDILRRYESFEEREKFAGQRAKTLTRLAGSLPFAEGADEATLEEARSLLLDALEIRLGQKSRRGRAVTTNSLGLILERMGRPEDALDAYRDALTVYSEDEPGPFGVVLGNLCRVREELDDLESALSCYERALRLNRRAGYENAEAQHLLGLAQVEHRVGNLARSQERIEAAISALQSIRNEASSPDLKISYQTWILEAIGQAIEIALDRHEQEPWAGHGDRALQWLEGFRSRGLLESLSTPRLPGSPARRLAFAGAIRHLKLEILSLEGSDSGSAGKKLNELERRLDQSLESLHEGHSRSGSTPPRISTIPEAQALLDDETVLLQYHLGNPRGVVWVLTRDRSTLRFLPPAEKIEPVARRLHSVLRSGTHRIRLQHLDRLSAELSHLVLDPVADLLTKKRLVVIPAGSLRSIPFAVLPNPRDTGSRPPRPLLEDFRVSSAPSVSVVAALRERGRRRQPEKLVAMLASPVFRPEDPRLLGREVRRDESFAEPPFDLTRDLPFTEEEGRRILDLLGESAVQLATGFEANRGFVLDSALRDYQILHFATHGHLDSSRGELSGLVLSQFDAEGRAVDGFLWAYEIQDLDLAAKLVVLSACETGLGQETPGEGLVGLTHAFYAAGVERALVSLWRVDDRATARLMEFFYEALVQKGLPPAEALRRAQLRLREVGWEEPYYWAPFVLDGDWLDERLGSLRSEPSEKKSS